MSGVAQSIGTNLYKSKKCQPKTIMLKCLSTTIIKTLHFITCCKTRGYPFTGAAMCFRENRASKNYANQKRWPHWVSTLRSWTNVRITVYWMLKLVLISIDYYSTKFTYIWYFLIFLKLCTSLQTSVLYFPRFSSSLVDLCSFLALPLLKSTAFKLNSTHWFHLNSVIS